MHHIQRIADDRQRAQAQKVHFQKAQPLQRTHGVLSGDHVVIKLQGHVFGHGFGGNQHAGRMGAGMAGHALQRERHVQKSPHLRVALGQLLELRADFQRLGQRHVQREGNGLGHLIHGGIAHSQHAAHVSHHGLGLHGAEGDDLRDVIRAIFARHVIDHLLPAFIAEVDVQVGHAHALGVQETLKEQVVFERVQHGDAQRIGHDAARAAATAGTDHDAVALGVVDKVPHDEEVVHIPHAGNHVQLIGKARGRLTPGVIRLIGIARLEALAAQAGEHFQRRFTCFDGKAGQMKLAEFKCHLAARGDLTRLMHGLRTVGKEREHFRLALDIEFLGFHSHARLVLERLARLDAHEHLLGGRVLAVEIVAVVGGYQGNARLPCQRLEAGEHHALLRQAMVHDFHKVIALAEKRLHLKRILFRVLRAALQQQLGQIAAEARRQTDQPLGMLPEQVIVDARLVVKALRKPRADELDQVVIAGLVFAQQNHVAVFTRRAVLFKAVGTDIYLTPDDGGDPLLQTGVIEVDGAVHHAVIGHGGMRKAKLLKALGQGLDAVGPVQEAVFGMQMQMGEGHGCLLWAGASNRSPASCWGHCRPFLPARRQWPAGFRGPPGH